MHHPLFASAKQLTTYIKCVNNIEIGDSVECLILDRGFANHVLTHESYRFGDRWSRKTILPIIGKTSEPYYFCEQLFYVTAVGIAQDSKEIKCGYDQDAFYVSTYNIPKEYSHFVMYTNCDLDIIYNRIIKKKQ